MGRQAILQLILPVVAVALSASHASGDEIARGEELAKRWCTECHVTAANQPGGDAGPPFPAVAARPGQSIDALKAWLADPHPPMPDLNLSAPEFEALAVYILSLKEPK